MHCLLLIDSVFWPTWEKY